MGILDEAIREHLELKRQHGAEGDELKRLEDEAFGPPARPGEPDFAEVEAEVPSPEGSGAEAEVATEPPPAPAPPEAEQQAAEHEVVADPSDAETGFFDQSLEDQLGLGDVDL